MCTSVPQMAVLWILMSTWPGAGLGNGDLPELQTGSGGGLDQCVHELCHNCPPYKNNKCCFRCPAMGQYKVVFFALSRGSWGFLFPGGFAPTLLFFDAPVPTHGTDALRFAYRRAGGGETFFFTGYCSSARQLRGFHPRAPSDFSLAGKVTKRAHRGGDPFDGVPPLSTPPPRRHKGGRLPPFGIPRIPFYLSCLMVDTPGARLS